MTSESTILLSPMIYLTTFFLTLFLIQISRALPQACSNHISPASKSVQHRLSYGDAPHTLASVQSSMCDPKYDNPNGSMHATACANPLESRYPLFGDIPNFPYIGAASDVTPGSPNCGECWNLTNLGNGAHIYVTAIDSIPFGFVTMSVSACNALKIDEGVVEIGGGKVLPHFCGF